MQVFSLCFYVENAEFAPDLAFLARFLRFLACYGMYLCEWQVAEMSPTGKLRAAWASLQQLDVRYKYKGAYIDEPVFWSQSENANE